MNYVWSLHGDPHFWRHRSTARPRRPRWRCHQWSTFFPSERTAVIHFLLQLLKRLSGSAALSPVVLPVSNVLEDCLKSLIDFGPWISSIGRTINCAWKQIQLALSNFVNIIQRYRLSQATRYMKRLSLFILQRMSPIEFIWMALPQV